MKIYVELYRNLWQFIKLNDLFDLYIYFCYERRGIRLSHYGPCLNSSAVEEPCPKYCSDSLAVRDGPICV